MPELPDVAVLKSSFDSTALHQTVRPVEVEGEGRKHRPVSPELETVYLISEPDCSNGRHLNGDGCHAHRQPDNR